MEKSTHDPDKKLNINLRQAEEFIKTFTDIVRWSRTNMKNLDPVEWNSIWEDFLKNNEDIIRRFQRLIFNNENN